MIAADSVVIDLMREIFRAKGLAVPDLTPATELGADLGLESLDLAELVIRLEEKTGKDPFANGAPRRIQTISDLAALYGE